MSHSTIDTPELGGALNRYGPTAARSHPDTPARLNTTTVDAHAHVHIKAATEYMMPHVDPMRIAMVKHANDETRAVNRKQDEDRMPVAMSDLADRIVPYLNRLSDLLFTLARSVNGKAGTSEARWEPMRRRTDAE